jgi:plastocyanin
MKLLVLLVLGAAAGTLVMALGLATGSGATMPGERIVLTLDGKNWSRNLAVHPGTRVTLTIVNRTGDAHMFYSPGLHVNEPVPVGTDAHPSRVTFRFTVPTAGVFKWYCLMPCGAGMGGLIYAPEDLRFKAGWTIAT